MTAHLRAALALLVLAPACATEDMAEYSKQVEARDATGANRVVVTVTTDDPELLDRYDDDAITVIPVRADALPPELDVDDDAPIKEPDDGADDDYVDLVTYDVVSADLEPGVTGYLLDDSRVPQPKIGWHNYWYYSSEDCVAVQRVKLIRRVYVSLWVKATSGSSWDQKVENKKLGNNETLERCYTGSHELKVKVRTKKKKAFTIEFMN